MNTVKADYGRGRIVHCNVFFNFRFKGIDLCHLMTKGPSTNNVTHSGIGGGAISAVSNVTELQEGVGFEVYVTPAFLERE